MNEIKALEELRRMLDERGIEHTDFGGMTEWTNDGGRMCRAYTRNEPICVDIAMLAVTPEQAIAATLGRPTFDTDLERALSFMRIWISDDAHLGESDISYALERAEGLRNLDAIEQAIAATLGGEVGKTGRYAELFGTPERAAKTISTTAACVESETVCRNCEYEGYCSTVCGYDALLEWLRGDA